MDHRLKRHELGYLEVAERPTEQNLRDYYANQYYQNEHANYRKVYSDLELGVIKKRVELRASTALDLRKSHNKGRLLDVGCGEGFTLAYFRELGWDIKGVDFSKAGVEQMNPSCAYAVTQGDVFYILSQYIESSAKFDLIWLGNVLEHVLDPIGLLKSLKNLLVGDGVLVITVPNDGNRYHEELFESKAIENRFWIAIPDHISYFTKESLKNLATYTKWHCRKIQGDFPIDFYLAHPGSNYVKDRTKGGDAHKARLILENIIAQSGIDNANSFYETLASVGLGRNITAYLQP
jgi:SAM-dependent methyltransferase